MHKQLGVCSKPAQVASGHGNKATAQVELKPIQVKCETLPPTKWIDLNQLPLLPLIRLVYFKTSL